MKKQNYHLPGKDGLPGNLFESDKLYYQHDYQWYYPKVIKLVPRGSRVLDIGAGRGGLASYLQKELDCDVTVCDMSQEAIILCENKGLECIEMDIESQDIKGQWDIVLMTAVLEHLINPRQVLWKLRENLVDGGHIILAQSNFCDILSRIRHLIGYSAKYYEEPMASFEKGLQPSAHLHLFDKHSLTAILNLEELYPVRWEYATQPFEDALKSNTGFSIPRKFVSWCYHTLYNKICSPLFSEIVIVKAVKI